MSAHLRNSTGTNVNTSRDNASRDDRTLAPTAQPNAGAAITTNTSRYDRTLVLMRYRAEMTTHSVSLVRKTRRLDRPGTLTPSISPYLFKFRPKQSLGTKQ